MESVCCQDNRLRAEFVVSESILNVSLGFPHPLRFMPIGLGRSVMVCVGNSALIAVRL
ncbi:hypothetical protein MTR_4g052130 [Medicago truncatula]|uniref:Uncharacterized protein n=1 Tax=Medicago truncatula TaxID=3880 RepID=A0A072UK85_MEDTR|nr:hypothetical protein MTR_4g052130 [Medicago truncatula]